MIRKLLAVMLCCLPLWAGAEEAPAAADAYVEGTHFAAVVPPLAGATEGKVKVVELFWYGCPHCFQFDPTLQAWLKSKPANVEFERIPAIFNNPTWELHARAYYAADVMGVLEKIHEPLFDALHVKKQRLNSKEALRAFFVSRGVDGKEFDATFDSFAVSGLVRQAAVLTKQYNIDGVPAMAVQGKYRISGRMAGSYENMMRIVDFLVARESR
ncbi:MAG: thiol:disulfide interchange protein DsbA/DsbL [Gammaproteobacteria bacterium]|nr:thiol:disulfide interchange protein DsbA/DsbL [Gammaproteobacteria bacterium]